VMEASVSKTRLPHLIPLGLMVLGGEQGAQGVETVMRFIRLNKRKDPLTLVNTHIDAYQGPENDEEIFPGFGPYFEQRNPLYRHCATSIKAQFKDQTLPYLDWCLAMDHALNKTPCGVKATSFTAAVLLDLGFHPRSGPGIYQMLSVPGLLAHGLELANKPISAMPFVSDEHYHKSRDIG